LKKAKQAPSFSEEKEAKRLFYSGAWALAATTPLPQFTKVSWFFFSKKNCFS
jgi:hypothetical protein